MTRSRQNSIRPRQEHSRIVNNSGFTQRNRDEENKKKCSIVESRQDSIHSFNRSENATIRLIFSIDQSSRIARVWRFVNISRWRLVPRDVLRGEREKSKQNLVRHQWRRKRGKLRKKRNIRRNAYTRTKKTRKQDTINERWDDHDARAVFESSKRDRSKVIRFWRTRDWLLSSIDRVSIDDFF